MGRPITTRPTPLPTPGPSFWKEKLKVPIYIYLLMKHPALGTLNVEDEFYSACRHIEPLLLSKIK